MVSQLVALHGGEPRISTFDIFVGLGYKEHRMLKKVVKDSVLQIKEHRDQYELKDVPAFIKLKVDDNNKKYRFRIIYKLISTNFPINN